MIESKINDVLELYCVYVIGIGWIGVVYVEVLFWIGEIEDNFVNEGMMFVFLIVDIGDDYMQVVNDYVRLFKL